MYDTVVCSVDVAEGLDERIFQGGRMTQEKGGDAILRFWFNSEAEYLPRVTYWRRATESGGRLRIEFSIPKLAGLRPFSNVSEANKQQALHSADSFVRSTFSSSLPSVATWRAARIDYAWNWRLDDKLAQYMSVIQSLHMAGMTRHPFDKHGVVFKGKAKNTRWVKFYDKTREAGGGERGVLRFEVSNYRKVLPYMCRSWFGCEPKVSEVLQPGRALYCMAVMWDRLGLSKADVYASDESTLLLRLKRDYGNAASSALYALKAIAQYGSDAHSTYGLLSPNTYYTWKRRLQDKQYISEHDVASMDALHLPTHEVYQQVKDQQKEPDNLKLSSIPPDKDSRKIFWNFFAPSLGLAAPIPSRYLIKRWYEQSAA